MSESKHTPGPWSFDPDNVGRNFNQGYGIMPEGGGWTVAHVPMMHGGAIAALEANNHAVADAELIARAPDMLTEIDRLRAQRDKLLKACEVALVYMRHQVGEIDPLEYPRVAEIAGKQLYLVEEAIAAVKEKA